VDMPSQKIPKGGGTSTPLSVGKSRPPIGAILDVRGKKRSGDIAPAISTAPARIGLGWAGLTVTQAQCDKSIRGGTRTTCRHHAANEKAPPAQNSAEDTTTCNHHRERKAMTRLWAKREEQIHGVVETMAGLYGDLQGIAGRSLQEIEGLEVLLLDGPPASEAAE
jgi:hypothetical protein